MQLSSQVFLSLMQKLRELLKYQSIANSSHYVDVKEVIISQVVSLFIIIIIYIYHLGTGRLEGQCTQVKPVKIVFDIP